MDQKRSFIVILNNGSQQKLTIRQPTNQEMSFGDEEYAVAFNKALTDGLPTRVKLNLQLKRKGLIDQTDYDRMNQIRADVGRLDDEIRKTSKRLGNKKPADYNDHDKSIVAEIDTAQAKRRPLMEEFNEIRQAYESFFQFTADNKAENAKRNALIACTIEYDEGGNKKAGTRVWETVEDLSADTEFNRYQRCLYEYMMLEQDLPSDGDTLFGIVPEKQEEEEKQEEQGDQEKVNLADSQEEEPVVVGGGDSKDSLRM